MWTKLNHFVLSLVTRAQVMRDEGGQALVEYTLILALVSIVAIALLTTIGTDIKKVLEEVVKGLEKA
jgi:pilus assembly protein Flp/PilA